SGFRCWSVMNLLTYCGVKDSTTDLGETKRFATYYVHNYAQPQNRVSDIAFRSMRPGQAGAAATWNLMTRVDIADTVTVSVHGAAGGDGVFDHVAFFVEGVHEESRPLNEHYDDVTVSLDLSPRDYFDDNPWNDT